MKAAKSEPEFTTENLLRAATQRIHKKLVQRREAQNETIPPGWFSAEELARAMNLSPCSIPRTMHAVGAPQKRFRRAIGNSFRKVTYWKP